jgi:L-malate glycosyltransferase
MAKIFSPRLFPAKGMALSGQTKTHLNPKVKVIQFLGSLNPGGAEIMALDLFRNNTESDIEWICIYRREGDLSRKFHETGIKTIHQPSFNFLSSVIAFRRILKKEKAQIVHVHQNIDAFIACFARLFLPVKIVQSFHGHGFNYSLLMQFFRWWNMHYNNVNIFVSKTQLLSYERRDLTGKSIRVVLYNGINFEKLLEPSKLNFRDGLKIPQNVLLTGTVGNFSNGRDFFTLCRFFQLLKSEGVAFFHVFAGARMNSEPHLYDQCVMYCKEKGLSQNVLFLGKRNDISTILSSLDAFLYSSAHDTFGIAVVEAIAANVPVFVNDWEVMREITREGELATTYKSRDENDLLEKFLHFLVNRDSYFNKAKKAAEIVKQEYSIEKHIHGLKSIYQQALEI